MRKMCDALNVITVLRDVDAAMLCVTSIITLGGQCNGKWSSAVDILYVDPRLCSLFHLRP